MNTITRAQARANQLPAGPAPVRLSSNTTADSSIVTSHSSSVFPPTALVVPEERSPLQLDRIKEEQHLDLSIQTLINNYQAAPSAEWIFKNDVLHKVIHCHSQSFSAPILPASLVPKVLPTFHTHSSAEHFRRDRTFAKPQIRCFWPPMYEAIRSYIRSCVDCARYHIHRMKPADHLKSVVPPFGAFELVGIDFWGPTNAPSASNNRYVLVLTDYLTKYAIARPAPKNTAVATAEFLLDTTFTFGVPSHIITDQGTHFRNDLVSSLTTTLGCEHTFVTAYHPEFNGQVERRNATMRPKMNALY